MKKLISIVLTAIMLISVLPSAAFASSGTGYGWQWPDSEAYGWIKNYGSSSGSDMIVEMDASLVKGGEGAKFSFWTKTDSVVYNAVTGSATIGTSAVGSFDWGELSGTNWHHLRYIFNSGKATFEIDGKTVVSQSGIYAHDSQILFFSDWGILTIDNFKITNNAGTVIASCDFEDASQAKSYFGEGLGSRVEITSDEPDPTPTDEIGWVARIDGYGIIAKNIDKCDDYPEYNTGTVEFDLAMVPGTSGTAKLEIFEGYNGTVRATILPNAVGYFYTPDESEGYSAFSWGSLNLTNWRHVKYEHSYDDVKLYIDGVLVYTIGHGCTPALPGCNIYMSEGSAFIDNLVFTDSTGVVHGSFDFESGLPDCDGTQRVYIGNCDLYGHVPANRSVRVLDPTCTDDGYNSTACLSCGGEAYRTAVPRLGHAFGTYTDGKVTTAATETTDGTLTWTCSRCNAATATGTVVATGDYKGEIIAFDDMQNENVTKDILKGFDTEPTTADGVSYTGETIETEGDISFVRSYTDTNYHEFTEIDTSGFTVSFDFRVNGTFDTSDTSTYGHAFYFWTGGGTGTSNQMGYDLEENQFFIRASDGKTYDALTQDYTLEEGKWYNLTFKFYTDSTGDAWAALYCNGEEMIMFDDLDAIFELPFSTKVKSYPLLMRFFGVKIDITNFVIGDTDFEWINYRTPSSEEEVVYGDVDGNGKINVRDMVILKKYLAHTLDDTVSFVSRNADFNGDGRTNSRDLVDLKRYIANN